jgi:hypothetical protein
MKTKSIIITKPCAGIRFSYGANPKPQDVPEDIADDLLRAGHAITPGEAKKAAAPKKQTTTRKTQKETTAE